MQKLAAVALTTQEAIGEKENKEIIWDSQTAILCRGCKETQLEKADLDIHEWLCDACTKSAIEDQESDYSHLAKKKK